MSSSPSLPVALTIAGSDSSSGAGMQADLKAFAAHGVYGLCAVTSVVAEIPGRVVAWEPVDPTLLGQQLNTVASGFPIAAAKTGMLATPELVGETCDFLWKHRGAFPVVVDPVMVASSGDSLVDDEAVAVYRTKLLPLAALATPNLAEARAMLERDIDSLDSMDEAAREWFEAFGTPVVVKGGHLDTGDRAAAVDVFWDGESLAHFSAERVPGVDTHGTGCTFSAAVAANLARGRGLSESVERAKRYITAALRQSYRWTSPEPITALNHFPEGVS
ncbi:MAG: bifunctional hydroxymethylpyrimidine kinase/phosphomethylpyrimidine kinase [Verrucomicrobiae bacterium]|nr:bifunctional hydroxymethylpyrimidine kinase/phosphomethylpyrimidine kinase [Verrucomicrobiae bacterium]